ncbi:hypothetical protein MSZK_09540 [Mycobacterium sp. shizuoka-1]|nr:hypothetical protein MSZK_09540 [Mycobacterium sp. shizuoka-1]
MMVRRTVLAATEAAGAGSAVVALLSVAAARRGPVTTLPALGADLRALDAEDFDALDESADPDSA